MHGMPAAALEHWVRPPILRRRPAGFTQELPNLGALL